MAFIEPMHRNKPNITYLLWHFEGLVQERRNSIANALELRLSCTNPLIWQQNCLDPGYVQCPVGHMVS